MFFSNRMSRDVTGIYCNFLPQKDGRRFWLTSCTLFSHFPYSGQRTRIDRYIDFRWGLQSFLLSKSSWEGKVTVVPHWSRNGGIAFMRTACRDGSPCRCVRSALFLIAIVHRLLPRLFHGVPSPLKFYFSEQIMVPVGPELNVTLFLIAFIVRAAFSPPHLLL